MENVHHDNHETSDDDDDETIAIKERQTARAIGAVVESKLTKDESRPEPKEETHEQSYWPSFDKREDAVNDSEEKNAERDAQLAGDTEPKIDEISQAEAQLINRETVAAARAVDQAEAQEQAEADPAAIAAAAAVEHFREKIDVEGKSIEEAASETEAELHDLVDDLAVEAIGDHQAAAEYIDTNAISEGEIRLSAEDGGDDRSSGNTQATPAAAGAGHAAGGSATGHASGGSSGRPPYVPFGGASVPSSGYNPNAGTTANTASSPDMIDAADAQYYERKALSRGLLTGLVVGYLYGRRKGRLKAEKKAAPIRKKLEKDVKNLQSQLFEQEAVIRRSAREQVRLRGLAAAERISGLNTVRERAPQPMRSVAMEANQLHGKKPPAERIGQVLVGAEYGREERHRPAVAESASIEKRVETMTRAELLSLSEKITVDGTNLRQVYETHLIGERGLRRLVTEHLRGGDVKRVLRRELVEREIDFERDPILRDRARSSLSGGGKSALNNLLQQAGADGLDSSEEDAVLTSRANYQKKEAVKQKQQRRVVDAALGAVITLLAVLIAAVLIMHH